MIGEQTIPAIPHEALESLPTPSLVVNLAIVDRNIETMARLFRSSSRTHLRPHFKAHKTTALMRRQLAAGGCVGVTCATAYEALVLAQAGFDDILLANELADHSNLGLLARAAAIAKVTVAVDHPAHVELLKQTARRRGVAFNVVVDVDSGMHRTGLAPDDPQLLVLARAVTDAPGLAFVGIFAYEGHAQMQPLQRRRELVREASAATARARDLLERGGFGCPVITGGGSGTFDLSTNEGILTEIQAGSYVLMDATYNKFDLPFEPALFCVATVISRPSATTAVVNAGLKAMSFEKGPPVPVRAGLNITKLSDEHGFVVMDEPIDLAIGERLLLVPSHIDPTINLHDRLFVWQTDSGMTSWPVDGRRTSDLNA